MLPLGRQRSAAVPHTSRVYQPAPGLRQMIPLIVFTTLSVLVYAGDTVKFAYLPVWAGGLPFSGGR